MVDLESGVSKGKMFTNSSKEETDSLKKLKLNNILIVREIELK